MAVNSTQSFGGALTATHIKTEPHKAKSLRTPFGRLMWTRDKGDSGIFADQVFASKLSATHYAGDGSLVEAYDFGSGVVTTAGVILLSNDTAISAGAACFNVVKNHGVGTGTRTAAVGDTALVTPIGTTATAGVNTFGTVSTNATVISTCTVSPGAAAVTEWGLFNQTTLSGAKMWDYKAFAAINTGASDSIVFTYTVTLTAGG